MSNKSKVIKMVSLAAMVLGGASALLTSWTQEQTMEKIIDEKVNYALDKKLNEKKEEESI